MTLPHRFPRSETETEKIKRLVREFATPVRILAVDDLCLLGMPLGPSQASPKLIPKEWQPPVLASSNRCSTRHQRFACARLSQPCLTGSCPAVSATLTTIAFDDSSLRWLEINT
jgi:hypothetical protein